MTRAGSFFVREGATYVPTGLGASPWTPDMLGGIPLAGLSAHVLDRVPAVEGTHIARLTIDILGAVPQQPLTPKVTILREGRRLQLVQVELLAGERCRVRTTGLRMRTIESPDHSLPLTRQFPDIADIKSNRSGWAETIAIEGDFDTPGPGARWVRITCPVVAGEPISPLECVAMVSDFGSGIGSIVSPVEWSFANVDISIHLTRRPRGEWLLIDSGSESAGNGIGIANSRLSDFDGIIGSAHQTVFIDRVRPKL